MPDVRKVLKDYIVSAAHVGFVVSDLEAAVANASRVYGLQQGEITYIPEPGEDSATRFAFFTVGGLEFELIQPCSAEFREQLFSIPSGGAGINHVAWRVSDIETAVKILAREGIEPGHVTPDGIIDIGAKKMVYLDPATTGGLVIELLEYPADG